VSTPGVGRCLPTRSETRCWAYTIVPSRFRAPVAADRISLSSFLSLLDRIIVVYNPGRPAATRLAERLRDELLDRIPDRLVDLQPTRYAGHARELAFVAAASGRPLIVSVSGDGGYNDVVNGVMDRGRRDVVTAVLAGGNANDHRRSTRRMSLIKAITAERIRRIDLLRLTLDDGATPAQQQYAHSYIGFGLTPRMAIA
jgi:diacylglycerol kinase (ATP)